MPKVLPFFIQLSSNPGHNTLEHLFENKKVSKTETMFRGIYGLSINRICNFQNVLAGSMNLILKIEEIIGGAFSKLLKLNVSQHKL